MQSKNNIDLVFVVNIYRVIFLGVCILFDEQFQVWQEEKINLSKKIYIFENCGRKKGTTKIYTLQICYI